MREQGKKKWIFYAIKYVFEPPFGHLYRLSLGIILFMQSLIIREL